MSPDVDQVLTAVVTALALGGLAFLGRAAVKISRRLRTLNELAEQELTHNHGSSIKDDVHGIAVAVGVLQRDVNELKELKRDFYHHLAEREPRTP